MNTATTAEVSRRAGLTHQEGARFVKAILSELCLGRRVRLAGLGEFRVTTLPAREVRTPVVPGGRAMIRERRTIRFRRFQSAYARINAG